MSRIGKLPVKIPSGVTVNVGEGELAVKGPKGELTQRFEPVVEFELVDGECNVTRKDESKRTRSLHGLYRQLLDNMVAGVSQGYTKSLEINGVGYRAELAGENLVLNLGYSNPIEYVIPEGITISIEGQQNNRVVVTGISKELVGQTAAELRSLRPPEPYKGKGIKYLEEQIRRKVGKAGVK